MNKLMCRFEATTKEKEKQNKTKNKEKKKTLLERNLDTACPAGIPGNKLTASIELQVKKVSSISIGNNSNKLNLHLPNTSTTTELTALSMELPLLRRTSRVNLYSLTLSTLNISS